MSILNSVIGANVSQPIEAIGNVLDKLFTSDDEKLDKKIILERLRQAPQVAQQEINKIEASHRSIFIAGWRPFLGWVCGFGMFYDFILRPISSGFGFHMANIDSSSLHSLIIALLGLGAYRTVEKFGGKTK